MYTHKVLLLQVGLGVTIRRKMFISWEDGFDLWVLTSPLGLQQPQALGTHLERLVVV
jgi:hypothetical protein